MGIIVVIFNLYRVMEVDRLLKGLLKKDTKYANFEALGHWQELFNDFIAVAVFFAWIKVKYWRSVRLIQSHVCVIIRGFVSEAWCVHDDRPGRGSNPHETLCQ